jgi:hypothetical protein
MLEHGADVEAKDNDGETALRVGKNKTMKLLRAPQHLGPVPCAELTVLCSLLSSHPSHAPFHWQSCRPRMSFNPTIIHHPSSSPTHSSTNPYD